MDANLNGVSETLLVPLWARAVEGLITGSSTSASCRRVAAHLDSATHFT